MNKIQSALGLAEASLVAVEAEIAARNAGVSGVGTLGQLDHIRASCREIISQLESGKIRRTHFGISRIIIDSWPLSSTLGDLLIKTEKAYESIPVG